MKKRLNKINRIFKLLTLSIRARIIMGFSIVLLLVVAMTGVIFYQMNAISENDQGIADLSLPAMIEATTMNNEMLHINKKVNEASNATNVSSIEEIQEEIDISIKRLEKNRVEIEPLIEALDNEEIKQQYFGYVQQWTTYKSRAHSIVELALAGDQIGAEQEVLESIEYFDSANSSLLAIVDSTKERIEASVNQSVQLNESGISWVFIISCLVLLFTIGVIFLTIRFIIKPIAKISEQVETVAKGDFTAKPLPVQTNDELGKLTSDFNAMTASMKALMKEVIINARYVSKTSDQVVTHTEETKSGVAEVAQSISEVSTDTIEQLESMEHLKGYMKDITDHIGEVSDKIQIVTGLAATSKDKANIGKENMAIMINKVNQVEERVYMSVKQMNKLDSKFNEMEKIIAVIQGFSSQTNLLALNAAIEAERAGEAGKGFAVVASEVRKLAGQSEASTKQIEQLIQDLQNNTKETAFTLENTNQITMDSKQFVTNSSQSFDEIVEATTAVDQQIHAVLTNVKQVTIRAEKVTEVIKEISEVANQTTINTETVAGVSEEASAAMEEVSTSLSRLAEMSGKLQQSVSKFIVE
ncbi:methyl-accepting chemotaxis protein [Paraliobacillus sp. X-1268]|uniref:methyl-accepting chemotaxis protein n=1 Tax=Paraliobacillus sp. X-1268 TaxID=2213193 RepID=UPI000E3BB51B|nr:methyl-accepting chemotaxis protein [Paraliobacillus sp. X-1268]